MSIPNGYFLGPYSNLLHSWGLIACKHHAPPSSNANHWPLKFCSYRGCLVGYSIPKPNLWELISLFLCDLPLQKHQGWEKSTKDPLRNNWINAFTTVGHTPANHIKELLPITGQSDIDISLILDDYIFAFRGALGKTLFKAEVEISRSFKAKTEWHVSNMHEGDCWW